MTPLAVMQTVNWKRFDSSRILCPRAVNGKYTRAFSHPLFSCCYMSRHASARCFYHLQLEIHLEVIHSSNTLGRRLMLASAGLLLCANGALAAEVVGDAQMQARDLLSGTVGGRPKIADVYSAIPTDDRHVLNLDPQEQARDLILGKNFAGTAHQAASLDSKTDAMPAASVQHIRSADIGGQELAQRMLLGKEV
jgi:hypothetical protein